MHIVINHLTRMSGDRICMAGIDLRTGDRIRPVLDFGTRFTARVIDDQGSPINVGSVIDLGPASHVGRPPEIEDRLVKMVDVKPVDRMQSTRFWNLLNRQAKPTLHDVFGPALELDGYSCYIPEGHGCASLGCIRAVRLRNLFSLRRDEPSGTVERLRLSFDVEFGNIIAPVTDVRLHRFDANQQRWDINYDGVRRVQNAVRNGDSLVLSVGLTRPFKRAQGDSPRHWLQVNNIHFEDDPLGLRF